MKALISFIFLCLAAWAPYKVLATPTTYPITGTLKPSQVTSIGSEVSGRVREVLVSVGSVVEKGQVLVKLDPKFFETALEAQKNATLLAKLAFDDAQVEFSRMENLWKQGQEGAASISKKQYDLAQSSLKQQKIMHQQTLINLDQSQKRLEETLIKAPYSGVITKRFVDPGEAIISMPATHLLEIMDLSSLVFEFSVPQNKLGIIRKGLRVTARVDGLKAEIFGKIDQIFPDVDPATRSVTCRLFLHNDHPEFVKPGCFMTATIHLEEEM